MLAVGLQIRNDSVRQRPGGVAVPHRLLAFVWLYPLTGENQASWAVKESAVLRGSLGVARDEPGLGVAIITTELALEAFGGAAESRVDRCIRWGLDHSESVPPFQVVAGLREQSSGVTVDVRPDLRHTLAFAVILARSRRHVARLEAYVHLACARQDVESGGWPADSVATISPVFTAIYAVELLHLASAMPEFDSELRSVARRARHRGIEWLIASRDARGLWTSGNLAEFGWDRALATAWVLHRLIQTDDHSVPGWHESLTRALMAMLDLALDPKTWVGCGEDQRQRVEARIASAAARVHAVYGALPGTVEVINPYIRMWRDRALVWLRDTSDDELDVATAAFMVQGLASHERLRSYGKAIAAE